MILTYFNSTSRGFFVICPEFADGTAACTILPKGSQIRLPGETPPLGFTGTGSGSSGVVKRPYRPLPKGVDVKGQVVIPTFSFIPSHQSLLVRPHHTHYIT